MSEHVGHNGGIGEIAFFHSRQDTFLKLFSWPAVIVLSRMSLFLSLSVRKTTYKKSIHFLFSDMMIIRYFLRLVEKIKYIITVNRVF